MQVLGLYNLYHALNYFKHTLLLKSQLYFKRVIDMFVGTSELCKCNAFLFIYMRILNTENYERIIY